MTPLIIFTALLAVLAAALPSPSNQGAQTATATITFARNTQCTPDNTPELHVTAGAGCVAFPGGAQSLRVVGVSEGNSLRYNSCQSSMFGRAGATGGTEMAANGW
ncbi:uncharacterized protein CC84DRAFT_1264871 [Paraphaeosphaeria sporulosa]|uniref:Uncharacterized protein n=1 Tax=Paraphaeosphaeria sporulosa TaxID=1460663 RepID=A0A177BTS8_9PLEO|nr:uncharacterized protein CC84DRAFT_1264871 [Paraphaeosphaeria sporulosa]OAF98664.1 hypothetical protein CC84DRAFT_1264871 [Paraphaeosphaeria sporulosa]